MLYQNFAMLILYAYKNSEYLVLNNPLHILVNWFLKRTPFLPIFCLICTEICAAGCAVWEDFHPGSSGAFTRCCRKVSAMMWSMHVHVGYVLVKVGLPNSHHKCIHWRPSSSSNVGYIGPVMVKGPWTFHEKHLLSTFYEPLSNM